MTPALAAADHPADQSNALQRLGFLSLAGFIFAFISRFLDAKLPDTHIPLLLAAIAGMCTLLSGRLSMLGQRRVTLWYAALTVWFAAGIPFAVWPGGSAGMLRTSWARSTLIWAFVVCLTTTFREACTLLNTLAWAAPTAAVLVLSLGTRSAEGRIEMAGGQLGNPNDIALVLLVGLPFLWRIYHGGRPTGIFRRAAALLAISAVGYAFLKTGSRGGLFSVVFLMLLVILRAPARYKVQLTAAGLAVLTVAFALMPAYLRNRYLTFSMNDEEEATSQVERTAIGFAATSTESRKLLLSQSLRATLTHPVFGVGLGNFPVYVYDRNKELGQHQAWAGTHNTYTQFSSEGGIPALILFVVILLSSWRTLGRVIRTTRDDPRPAVREMHIAAQSTQLCLGVLAFFIVFAHTAYDVLPHLVIALAVVVARTAASELQHLGPPPAATISYPWMPPRKRPSSQHREVVSTRQIPA